MASRVSAEVRRDAAGSATRARAAAPTATATTAAAGPTAAPPDTADASTTSNPPAAARPPIAAPDVDRWGAIPRSWAFVGFVAVLAALVADDPIELWLVPVVLCLGTFVHQLGHLLGATLAGLEVLDVRIGFGPPVLRLRIDGTPLTVGAALRDGYVLVGTTDGHHLRRRTALFALSGVGLCVLVAAAVAVPADGQLRIALLAGVVLQLANLLPFGPETRPGAESDGLVVLNALFDDRDLHLGLLLPLRLFRITEMARTDPTAALELVTHHQVGPRDHEVAARLLALSLGGSAELEDPADDLAFLLEVRAEHPESTIVQTLTAMGVDAVVARQLRQPSPGSTTAPPPSAAASAATVRARSLEAYPHAFPLDDELAWEVGAT